MFALLFAACTLPVATPGGDFGPASTEGDPPELSPTRAAHLAAPVDLPDWTVDCAGGEDFTTIGEAIDVAHDGDWIAVAPCTYHEALDFAGKTLRIASEGSSADTVLDPGGTRAVTDMYGTGDATALVGFTIQNSRDTTAVVYAEQSAILLQDVSIIDSTGGYAVIYGASSDIELQDVSIDDSNVLGYYGAILISRGDVVADNLSVSNRARSYAAFISHGSYFIDHSTLDSRAGYSLYLNHATGRVHRSTLASQVYVVGETDHYTDTVFFENDHFQANVSVSYGSAVFRNSFLDGSVLTLDQVYGFYVQASVVAHTRCPISYTYSTATDTADTAATAIPVPIVDVSYSDFYDDDSENCDGVTVYSGDKGNIALDPLFTDEAALDFTTVADSPLVDAGLPDAGYDDPDGTPNDIGLYGGPRSIGGGW